MSPIEQAARVMPDVANEARARYAGRLDWVGMSEIEMPVTLAVEGGVAPPAAGRISAYVNLTEPHVRGIHMSRLYLHLDRCLSAEALTPASLRHVLSSFLDSHPELSDEAFIQIEFDYLVRRPALRSDNAGWKRYPIYLSGTLTEGKFREELGLSLYYSSTCPCSAALARQLIQRQFRRDFPAGRPLDYNQVLHWLGTPEAICATPHSQRSLAEVRAVVAPSFDAFPFLDLIDNVEARLATPVQAAVKREDEQAFAELNARNLMFCEDAARRIRSVLAADDRLLDYWVRTTHFESLHPHNAVATVVKGVAGGFQA